MPLLAFIPKPADCTPAAVKKAYEFLRDESLVDVAANPEGKAIIIALALSIIERALFPARPIFFITAGVRGGGKTTVLAMVILAATGVKPSARAWTQNVEERRKSLLAILSAGMPAVVWDNIPRGTAINCQYIEAASTAEVYQDRILGVTQDCLALAYTIMAFTGNNIHPHEDQASRSLEVSLDADRPDPENRVFAPEGVEIGRRHVATLMKRMGIEAIYRKPNTSNPTPGHKIYPYLLRKMQVIRPNQVWAMDITYIPMAHGFVYLAAVVDWSSRRVLSHRVSITMEADFCIEALEEALAHHGRPEIFNTDQGSQFTSTVFTDVLLKADIAISMDGKGSWRDNVFVERLWRSIKYEEVVCCGNLLRGGAGQLYRRWRKVLRRRSAGAVFKPPQAARVKSSRGERCWKRRDHPVRYVS